MTERSTFRPDLEGLRAVAVLLVLAFHARIPGVGGGYIGVDVFFVLSGFLITGLLIRELSGTGGVNLAAFYARRARRLLPAAAATLLATIVASAVLLPPLRLPDIAADTAAAGLYVSNMRFAIQATDYLGSTLPPSPVLHFWSLGVEEQFYLFWPALLLLASGVAFRRRDVRAGLRRLGIALSVTLVISFGVSLWLTDAAQAWAFFSLPARAWELAMGALLALPAATLLVPDRARSAMGWTGLAMVVASAFLLNADTQFPGTAALLPTLGSALVIASGLRLPAPQPIAHAAGLRRAMQPGTLLALPPMRFLGRISYSLYLWHWPILVLPTAVAGGSLPGAARVALAALAIVVAAASQRWIEDPIRHGRFIGLGWRRSLAMAGLVSLVVALASFGISTASTARVRPTGPAVGGGTVNVPLPSGREFSTPPAGTPAPGATPAASMATPRPTLAAEPVPADLVPALTAAADDLPVVYSDGCHLDVTTVTPGDCVFGVSGSSTTVVLIGDSHAAQWFPALERLSEEHGWRLISMTKSACTTADTTVYATILKRAYTECDAWRQAVLSRIATLHPSLVVVSNSRSYNMLVNGAPVPIAQVPAAWDAAQLRTLAKLATLATHVLMIGDTPRSNADPPACLSAHLDNATACAMPWSAVTMPGYTAREAAIAVSAGAIWVDPTAWICRTDPCPVIMGRFLIYRDQHHLTATYSRGLADALYLAMPQLGP